MFANICRHSGLILALLTGAFDTSSAVLLGYRLIYDATNGTFTPQRFFTAYLIVPVFIVLVQCFVMPSTSYQTVGDMLKATGNPSSNSQRQDGKLDFEIRETNLPNQGKSHQENVLSELSPLLGKKDSDRTQEQEEQKRRISGIWGALHGLSAIQQIKTPWWIL